MTILDVDADREPTSRSWTGRSTATRWSTWTAGNTSQKPRQVHRRDARALRAAQRQRGPLGAHAGHRGDRGVRGRPRAKIAAFVGARHRRRDRLHEELDRGDQPGRARLLRQRRRSPAASRAGRRDRDLRDGAPLQHRAVAAALRSAPAPRCAGSASPTRAGSTCRSSTNWSTSAPSWSRSCTCPTCSARSTPSTRIVARARAGRRAGAAGRLAVGAAPAGRRDARWASTSSRSPATRCSARPASACCGGGSSCSTRCRRSSAAAR